MQKEAVGGLIFMVGGSEACFMRGWAWLNEGATPATGFSAPFVGRLYSDGTKVRVQPLTAASEFPEGDLSVNKWIKQTEVLTNPTTGNAVQSAPLWTAYVPPGQPTNRLRLVSEFMGCVYANKKMHENQLERVAALPPVDHPHALLDHYLGHHDEPKDGPISRAWASASGSAFTVQKLAAAVRGRLPPAEKRDRKRERPEPEEPEREEVVRRVRIESVAELLQRRVEEAREALAARKKDVEDMRQAMAVVERLTKRAHT